ncbi:MAG: KH domain-containing protein [Rubrobacter sp.]|nr:KH domain-containing protein [Rubrobacter sp.]
MLRVLVRPLVERPEEIEISSREEGSRVRLSLRVADEDVGRIIGRQGRTINAIRKVVKAASVRMGKRVDVEVPD